MIEEIHFTFGQVDPLPRVGDICKLVTNPGGFDIPLGDYRLSICTCDRLSTARTHQKGRLMPTLHVVSDLHLEFCSEKKIEEVVDRLGSHVQVKDNTILVIAGDLAPLVEHTKINFFLLQCKKYWIQVLWVYGNHEYYGISFKEAAFWKKHRTHWLKSVSTVEGGNWCWAGAQDMIAGTGPLVWAATGWYPPRPENALYYSRMMYDAQVIKESLCDIEKEGAQNIDYLHSCRLGDTIVGHHIPSPSLVHQAYSGSKSNLFFMNEKCEEVISTCQPKYWIFGHAHDSTDKKIENTRCICNPLGYWKNNHFENESFNWSLFIEV